jgi:hypothetical protein
MRRQRLTCAAVAASVAVAVLMTFSWMAPVDWIGRARSDNGWSQWWLAFDNGRIRVAYYVPGPPQSLNELGFPEGLQWGGIFQWQDQFTLRAPREGGFWLEAPLWPALLGSLFALLLSCGLEHPRAAGHCSRCGYDLHGLAPKGRRLVTCPECGTRSGMRAGRTA